MGNNEDYIKRPYLDLLRRYCILISSLREFADLKERLGECIHVIPYRSITPSLRATIFPQSQSVCFAVFEKGYPGTVGGTALNMRGKYFDLACDELKDLKLDNEIVDFRKKINEISESAKDELEEIEDITSFKLNETYSFLNQCLSIPTESLDNRLENVKRELKKYERY